MKQFLVTSIVFSILSLHTTTYAASVGNTAKTLGSAGRFSLGLEVEKTERDLDFDGGSFTDTINGTVTDSGPFLDPGESISDAEFESTRIFLKGTIGAASWLDFFVKLGTADADADFTIKETGFPDAKLAFEGDNDLAYGVGAKAELGNVSGWHILANAQYLMYQVDGDVSVNGIDIASAIATAVSSGFLNSGSYDAEMKINELQLALYAAQTFGIWTPYGGLKYSNLEVEFEDKTTTVFSGTTDLNVDTSKADFEAADNVGILIGTDVEITPRLTANIELRFIDETAGTLGVNWHF